MKHFELCISFQNYGVQVISDVEITFYSKD